MKKKNIETFTKKTSSIVDAIYKHLIARDAEFIVHSKEFGPIIVSLDYEDFDYQNPVTIAKYNARSDTYMSIINTSKYGYHICIGMYPHQKNFVDRINAITAYVKLVFMHVFGDDLVDNDIIDAGVKMWMHDMDQKVYTLNMMTKEWLRLHFGIIMQMNPILGDLVYSFLDKKNQEADKVIEEALEVKSNVMAANIFDQHMIMLMQVYHLRTGNNSIHAYRPMGTCINIEKL